MADKTTTTPPALARPDLSHLLETEEGRALYTRIVLESVRAGDIKWTRAADAWWMEVKAPDCTLVLVSVHDDGGSTSYGLPDPERDPAAAWYLMVRETAGVHFDPPDAVGLWWRRMNCRMSLRDEGPVPITAECDRDLAARRAVVQAVLHKYAADPAWSDLIRPLLDAEARHG